MRLPGQFPGKPIMPPTEKMMAGQGREESIPPTSPTLDHPKLLAIGVPSQGAGVVRDAPTSNISILDFGS
jgi:hypothetical protein